MLLRIPAGGDARCERFVKIRSGHLPSLGTGSFSASHLAVRAPEATAGRSPEGGDNEAGTHRYEAHGAIETRCRA